MNTKWKQWVVFPSLIAVMALMIGGNINHSRAAEMHHTDAVVAATSQTNNVGAASDSTSDTPFYHIFSTDHFIPRAVCMNREPFTLFLYALGSFAVFWAYLAIPLLLLGFRSRLREAFPKLIGTPFLLAALFILFCGGGHLIDIILIKYAFYKFAAIWTCGTGIISWAFFLYVVGYLKEFLHIDKGNNANK